MRHQRRQSIDPSSFDSLFCFHCSPIRSAKLTTLPYSSSMKTGIVWTLLASWAAVTVAKSTFTSSRASIATLRGGAAVKRPGSVKTYKQGAAATSSPKGKGGSSASSLTSGGTATIPNEIFNLVKAIVGVGVLSLPAGIAAFGNNPGAIVPALSLIAIIGILSGYGFAVIGKVCAYTGATSYRDAWSKSVGPSTSWIPAWSTTCKTFLACLAFSMVLADTFSSLLGTAERTKVLLGVTVTLLPLCLLKNLSSLAPFSLVGVLGMAYTALAMSVRYVDGSYAPGGKLLDQVPTILQPSFGDRGMTSVFSPSSLILVCMLSTAYMAHFNSPKFYNELKNNTLPRFHTVVASSFGISILLMGFITALGFLTFGQNAAGLVLNNYASKDSWMSLSRVAVAISLVFSYPLAFQGCRDGILDLLQVPAEKKNNAAFLNLTTVALLSVLTLLAAVLTDVKIVLALGGATLGNALTYVYPALMYRAIVKKQNRKDQSTGVLVSSVAAVLGIVVGAIGVKMALE